MKIDKKYDYIVLDATLYYPANGKPNNSDNLSLLAKMVELKEAYPDSRCVLVFDGGEQSEQWRDRQSNAAFCNGWISSFIEGETQSRCIHSLVSLANAERASSLIFSSTVADLRWVSNNIEFVMVDDDGDLCRHWTLTRFIEVFGLEPECLTLINALSGWGTYKSLVPEERIQMIVQHFRLGLPLEYGGEDLSSDIEERLALLDVPEPDFEHLNCIRKAFRNLSETSKSRFDG